ncbi:hypothetical protein O0I10_001575 [Lichtheimia ornata]|uniref:Uncharacterized protein n=1 Tax=Lichtheimia ornata TaxID=688661 RepID=A0AAD7VAV2_9FUNG|nr:uncharacterized protein O0I10_001575 [Lichtheimia ornata]KAJ8662613.1 hypothetical protein O0I10_001575 [Lichtheimia ornata]
MAPDVSCYCGVGARKLVTKKEGRNKGRWFWTCPTRQCRFFKWDNSTPRETDATPLQQQNQSTLQPSNSSNNNNGSALMISQPRPAASSNTARSNTNHAHEPIQIYFMIHSSNKIGIRVQCDPQVIAALRSIPAQWDPVARLWLVSATKEMYDKAIHAITSSTARLGCHIHPLPKQVIHILEQEEGNGSSTVADKDERLTTIQQSHVWPILKEFQKQGVREGLRRGGRMLLGDEMGLGKTLQALVISQAYKEAWPVLVICPSSLRFTWKGEIRRWLKIPEDEIYVVLKGGDLELTVAAAAKHGATATKTVQMDGFMMQVDGSNDDGPRNSKRRKTQSTSTTTPKDIQFYVISYDLATKDIETIKKCKFKFIICDESHYIKSPQTKRTKALKPILQKSDHVLLLSGTPAFSRPIELFTQINALCPKLFQSRVAFGDRYCQPQVTPYGVQYKGAQNLSELNFILEKTILVRRLKDEVGLELPAKMRQTVIVQPSQKDAKAVKQLGEGLDRLQGSKDGNHEKQAKLLEMYTATGLIKIPIVCEYLNHMLESTEERILIFAYHKTMMDSIAATLEKNNVEYIRIDGKTDPRVRQELCEKFQSPTSKVQVALLSIVIGVGLTLSMADIVIFAELFWTPSQLLQSEDRAHRMGRIGPVTVKYILALNTLDITLWKMIKKKLTIIGEAIDGNATKVTIDEKLTTEYESIEDDGFEEEDLDEEGLIDITESTCQSIASQLTFS